MLATVTSADADGAFAGLCGRVALLTPYREQVRTLEEELCRTFGPRRGWEHAIDVASVDAYQGRERDLVLYSCVRAGKDKGLGFVKDLRRLNVALTRARHALFVVGNEQALRQSTTWASLIDDARARGLGRDVSLAECVAASQPCLARAAGKKGSQGAWLF